jgi:hypothetical protein
MAHRAHHYRIRYFGPFGALCEIKIVARDAAAAINKSHDAEWPPKAIGFWIIDPDGREIFQQLRIDCR